MGKVITRLQTLTDAVGARTKEKEKNEVGGRRKVIEKPRGS